MKLKLGLNPCFSGSRPRRDVLKEKDPDGVGLNPCFSGSRPRSRAEARAEWQEKMS